ncbi:metal chaperone, involved in Zn homeostasis, GTPase of family protein [Subtercola boreus]|uniref:Metal chaperone, involved in Zn homeostasis, GTPase of family protein n=1 Tax=Subtercola boreus TaxID=120213 RepID=A0A3E0VW17_9MICO|nr:D-arabinono-1,4-lactone oxidase [Subtercola boreus]RFA13900.1 metal chaperone, involved in Zn homeostasis, GTPase of family protein [Subtercola boreus]
MTTTQLSYPPQEPELVGEDTRLRNWAKNSRLGPPGSVVAPATEAELCDFLATSDGRIRMIGSRMSPGRMIEVANGSGTLLDLSRLSGLISSTDDTATFAGSTPLAYVYAYLSSRGQMLPASPGVIAEQTLAGAVSTGTHGQGLEQSSIAGAAVSIRMVLADGTVAEFDRDHPDFGAVQLSLGSLGVITAVTLRTRTSIIYTCIKTAVDAGNLEADLETWNRENIMVKAWWFPQEGQVQVWKANEATDDELRRYNDGGGELLKHAATNQAMNDTVESTLRQLRDDTRGVADDGKPLRTVSRFRDFTDITGDVYQVFCRGIATPQINVEIGIPLARAGAVIAKIKQWHAETQPRMHYPVILRCTGPSDGWLSPSRNEDTCYFGFVVYYAADGSLSEEGGDFLRAVERVVAEEGGRPHWGKYFDESLYDWPALYPEWEAFQGVREALDPQHRFANAFTAALLD